VSNELNKHLAGPQPRVEDFWFTEDHEEGPLVAYRVVARDPEGECDKVVMLVFSEVQQTFWVGSMDIDGNFEPVNVIKLGGHAA
jgi:hypothetical protein